MHFLGTIFKVLFCYIKQAVIYMIVFSPFSQYMYLDKLRSKMLYGCRKANEKKDLACSLTSHMFVVQKNKLLMGIK